MGFYASVKDMTHRLSISVRGSKQKAPNLLTAIFFTAHVVCDGTK